MTERDLPTIYVIPAGGEWLVHELDASEDSGVLLATAETKAEATAAAYEARRREYPRGARIEIPGDDE
ncbi:MAG: hypothetical protein ACQEUZ_02275 [Pseudomonadota bacterium]